MAQVTIQNDYPVHLNNVSRHGKYQLVQARLERFEGAMPVVRVLISDIIDAADPLVKELAETKAVLGDLLKEKLSGLKVYVLQWKYPGGRSRQPLGNAYTSLEEAQRVAEAGVGEIPPGSKDWASSTPIEAGPRWWETGDYLITEHQIA